ncbi:uncharacterized protein EI90DRAFT_3038058 [Cantharellus anzutake]|uniref:uncharacterized protein n=1 Tax=Cantharellus anzutake TaxID=1750568 RepID=UPI0019085E74|nr:uncharacterized protein EI90DRAFT_3038058 [Cantharellus anzutake]KAF8339867.1 hypothetical protein EI90DRAFT_3038058 [Cantharellus anzutake]
MSSSSARARSGSHAVRHVQRHPSINEDDEAGGSGTQLLSGTIDLADAMGDAYPRKRMVPQMPMHALSVESTPKTVPSATNSASLVAPQVEAHSSSSLSISDSGQHRVDDQSSHILSRPQSFSEARRAMQLAHPMPTPSRKNSSGSTAPKPQPPLPPPAFLPPPPPPEEPPSSTAGIISPSELKPTKSFPKDADSRSGDRTPHSRAISRHTSRNPLDEKTAERHIRIRKTPHLPHFHSDPISCATMYWSKAPVHGHMPTRGFRASTVTVIDSIAWIFGGMDESGVWNDIYSFDLETLEWSHPDTQGDKPPPCRAHSATPVNSSILVFGGGDGNVYYNHLYHLDTITLNWTKFTCHGLLPPPRRAHTCILFNGWLYVFGGGTGTQALGDLWALDITQPAEEWCWVCLYSNPLPLKGYGGPSSALIAKYNSHQGHMDHAEGPRPTPRGYHTANLVNNTMVVIGGSDGSNSYNDVWLLDLHALKWKHFPYEPDEVGKILAHSSTQIGSYLFVVGGHVDGVKYTHDVRLLNLVTLKWEAKAVGGRPPSSRGYHQCALFDSRLFLFGGFEGEAVFDDVWILDLAASSYLSQVTVFEIDEQPDEYDEEDGEYEEDGEEYEE